MKPETERIVIEALRRIVKEAFNPPTKRHRRHGFAGRGCDATCQPCALEQGRKALELAELELEGMEEIYSAHQVRAAGQCIMQHLKVHDGQCSFAVYPKQMGASFLRSLPPPLGGRTGGHEYETDLLYYALGQLKEAGLVEYSSDEPSAYCVIRLTRKGRLFLESEAEFSYWPVLIAF